MSLALYKPVTTATPVIRVPQLVLLQPPSPLTTLSLQHHLHFPYITGYITITPFPKPGSIAPPVDIAPRLAETWFQSLKLCKCPGVKSRDMMPIILVNFNVCVNKKCRVSGAVFLPSCSTNPDKNATKSTLNSY